MAGLSFLDAVSLMLLLLGVGLAVFLFRKGRASLRDHTSDGAPSFGRSGGYRALSSPHRSTQYLDGPGQPDRWADGLGAMSHDRSLSDIVAESYMGVGVEDIYGRAKGLHDI